jgi:hypothetical protein
MYRGRENKIMTNCQSSEGCTNRATHWILIEYSWPTLPSEKGTYLPCMDHVLHAQRSASNQMEKYPETGIKIIDHGALAVN